MHAVGSLYAVSARCCLGELDLPFAAAFVFAGAKRVGALIPRLLHLDVIRLLRLRADLFCSRFLFFYFGCDDL